MAIDVMQLENFRHVWHILKINLHFNVIPTIMVMTLLQVNVGSMPCVLVVRPPTPSLLEG